MVVVAQLVRAPDCGSGGRRFETDLPPKKTKPFNLLKGFFCGSYQTLNPYLNLILFDGLYLPIPMRYGISSAYVFLKRDSLFCLVCH